MKKMKNNLKTLLCFSSLLALVACTTNDKEPIASANGFELRKDDAITSAAILDPANDAVTFAKFNWDESNFGIRTVASDSLVISDHDTDPTFANAVTYKGSGIVITPDSRVCSIKNTELNALMNKLTSFNCGEMKIDVRIKSTLGINNEFIQYSTPITFSVTAYSLKLPIMAFVKDGNAPEEEPRIAASSRVSNTDYEGYMYLETGTYKLYQPDACYDFATPTIYGGTAGILNTGSSTTSISITTAGHYVVKVNLATNTYSIKNFTTFGIFGAATRSGLGFANQIPFDYDTTTKIWSLQVSLINGKKFKFKSNLWSGALVVPALPNPPYAPNTGSSVTILGKTTTPTPLSLQENSVSGSGDITVPGTDDGTRDTYRIELDIRNPRDYKYKITKI
jgi:hypothetical protein